MPTRTLQIVLAGDALSASRSFKKVGDDAEKMGKRVNREGGRLHGFATLTSKGFGRVGLAAGGMATAGSAAAALLTKSFVSGASDINESLTKNQVLFGRFAKSVDDFSHTSAKSFGISRQATLEYTGTFGNLFRALGETRKRSAGMSVDLTKLAADMASFNNASIEDTLEAIRSGIVGETEPLRRFGVNLNDATLRQQALSMGLTNTTKNVLTPHQKALAAVALITKQTSAAHGDFARTSGGLANQQRILKARLSDSGAELGAKLMPAALRAVKALNSLFDSSSSGGRVIASLGRTTTNVANALKGAWQTAVAAVRRFLNRHQEDVESVRKTIHNLGVAAKFVFTEIVVPVVKRAVAAIGPVLRGLVQVLKGVVEFVTGVLTGNWKRAWSGLKDIAVGQIKTIVGVMKGAAEVILELAKRLGAAIIKGIVAGLKGLAGALKDAVVSGVKKGLEEAKQGVQSAIGLLGIGDGIGKKIGDGIGANALGFMGSTGGPGSLMGADRDLMPFASIAGRMGLQTTSGLRPGSITSSGNVSYHSSGDAIDESGSPGAMMRYFKFLRGTFGSKLRELIYTPGGVGIKDGRPYRYSGQVAADHYDHVHVAYTGPFGDGIGDMRNLWKRAGGRAGAANMAAAIAMAESGGRRHPPDNVNTDGSVDRGPWQINSVHGRLSTHDPLGNARAAVSISGNGRNWNPWTTFKSGAYRAFLGSSGSSGGGRRRRVVVHHMSPQERFQQTVDNALDASRTARVNAGRPRRPGTDRFGRPIGPSKGFAPGEAPSVDDIGGDTGGGGADDQALIDAINANTQAQADHKAALDAVSSEMKRNTDLAEKWGTTSDYVKTKYIADLISGTLGRGIVGRVRTPGTGVEHAY